jgi:hypothetical protein
MQFIVLEKTDFVEGEVAVEGKMLTDSKGLTGHPVKNACLLLTPLLLLGKWRFADTEFCRTDYG